MNNITNKQIADMLTVEAYQLINSEDPKFTIKIDNMTISCNNDYESILAVANKFRRAKRDRRLYTRPSKKTIKRPPKFSTRIYNDLLDNTDNADQYRSLYNNEGLIE